MACNGTAFITLKGKYKKEFTHIAYAIHNLEDCEILCNGWAYSTNSPIRLILNSVTFNSISNCYFNYRFYQCNNFNLSLIPLSILVGITYKDGLRMVPCTETCRHNKRI
jgi:hypothetical protein